ncbi:hypothetical protein KFL_001560240 [Klebsormidium nitens]|uniref:Uncharacterized protein n=1 Tax=Klebsormidium nitens TaxID=105231 RepID=A0A1Y1I4L1_KLENI|nr:hypothetical protein KFL_001560240 [Klebsormidium nitens]|eukprot:GAQ83656.1 hypothetical protein KFL_001560240 [Klebsormidium nitens]
MDALSVVVDSVYAPAVSAVITLQVVVLTWSLSRFIVSLLARFGDLAVLNKDAEEGGKYISSSLYSLQESSGYPKGENISSLVQQVFKMVISKEGRLTNARLNTTERDGARKRIFNKYELRHLDGLVVKDTGVSFTFKKPRGVPLSYAFNNYFSFFIEGSDLPLILVGLSGDYVGANLAVSYACGVKGVFVASSDTRLIDRDGNRIFNSSQLDQVLSAITNSEVTAELFDYSRDEVSGMIMCASVDQSGKVCIKAEGASYKSPDLDVCGDEPIVTSGVSYTYERNPDKTSRQVRSANEIQDILDIINGTFYSLAYGGDVVIYEETVSQLRVTALILLPLVLSLLSLALDLVTSTAILKHYKSPLSDVLGGLIIEQVQENIGRVRSSSPLFLHRDEAGIMNVNGNGEKVVFTSK